MINDIYYDPRDNSINWCTDYMRDFITLLPNESGATVYNTIRALQDVPLKRDTLVIPYTSGKTIPANGWRLGASDVVLVKLPGGYSITHRPSGVQIIGGLYKTRALALDQLPRVVIALKRAKYTIAQFKTLNY